MPPSGRYRFEARPMSDRPGGLWGLWRIAPWAKEECLAYGSQRRCEALARSLQAGEDARGAP